MLKIMSIKNVQGNDTIRLPVDEKTRDQISSAYDTVKDTVMGSVYCLKKEGVSEYGSKF